MQPFPIAYMPTITPPCFTLRSRRETGTIETANVRHVERWQTDSPAVQYSRRDVSGTVWYLDMNPTPSRLYRENLLQSQPFVVPAADSEQVRRTVALNDQVNQSLSTIQSLRDKLSYATSRRDLISQSTFKGLLVIPEETYKILLTRQKQIQIDTLSENPYFEKYDVASDSRNIVRELRGSVTEDVVDRGVAQSQKLLRRELESRWLPANYSENQGIDSLSAYELMRPRMNHQERMYR
jgi:hypothetical protein